jgi:L-lactate dehydrogenase
MMSARIARAILSDERAVFPVGSYNPRFGTTVSLPSVVGRQGVIEVLDQKCPTRSGKAWSVARLRETVHKYLVAS